VDKKDVVHNSLYNRKNDDKKQQKVNIIFVRSLNLSLSKIVAVTWKPFNLPTFYMFCHSFVWYTRFGLETPTIFDVCLKYCDRRFPRNLGSKIWLLRFQEYVI